MYFARFLCFTPHQPEQKNETDVLQRNLWMCFFVVFFKTASAMPQRAAATISARETAPWKLYFLAAADGYGQVTGLCVVGGMGR